MRSVRIEMPVIAESLQPVRRSAQKAGSLMVTSRISMASQPMRKTVNGLSRYWERPPTGPRIL